MSAAFVLDCSLALAWLFPDEATDHSTQLLDRLATETAVAPAWWLLEVTNVLALAERKGRISSAQSAGFIAAISQLEIEFDTAAPERAFDHLLPLCRQYQLTSYDAMYLDLAYRRGLPLATLDESLRRAAQQLDVVLLGR